MFWIEKPDSWTEQNKKKKKGGMKKRKSAWLRKVLIAEVREGGLNESWLGSWVGALLCRTIKGGYGNE